VAAPPPLRCAREGLRSATAALGGNRSCPPINLLRCVRPHIHSSGSPDSGWLTSVSRTLALENGTLPLGGRSALARMTFPPRRQLT
jgi:hypothetical protein